MLLEAQQPLLTQAPEAGVLATRESGLPGPAPAAAAGGGRGEETASTEAESLLEHGVVSPPHWDSLKRENAFLEAQLLAYRKKYKDEHPLIQETQQKLRQNEDALKVEIQFALKQYYSQLEALNIKEKAARQVEQDGKNRRWKSTANRRSTKASNATCPLAGTL
jgi:hypothetical protein